MLGWFNWFGGDMATVKLKSVELTEGEDKWSHPKQVNAVVNISVDLHGARGRGLDQDVTIQRVDGKWYASVALDDFPGQDTPEAAIDKLGQWLLSLSRGMKGRGIKHLRIGDMFKSKSFK